MPATTLIIIDIEATCWKKLPPPGQQSEIIEIGVCTYDLASGKHTIPLLSYHTMKGDAPTVNVGRHFTCQMPMTKAGEMRGLLM